MSATDHVTEYYQALEAGGPLTPFFAADDSLVKFGISEKRVGYEAVRDGLREQTQTTHEWRVRSHDLRVTEREDYAWFTDSVEMSWTVVEDGTRREFDARWSGTLERREDTWQFVSMHVSAPQRI